MTLDQAINILATDVIPNYPYAVGESARAIQLGIEALKWISDTRCLHHSSAIPPLPGESED